MNQIPAHPVNRLGISEKEVKYHATQLLVWLWAHLDNEPWASKLACGKTLAELTLRMVPLHTETNVLQNWAMIVAMMLNGTEQIYGDSDPFNMESGKSPEAQAWRLLVINSLPFLPGEGYVVSTVSRIALNTIDLVFELKAGGGKSGKACGDDIAHYLDYEGQGNSMAWFKQLDMMQYQSSLVERTAAVLDAWHQCFACFAEHMPKTSAFAACLTRQKYALQTFAKRAPKMIAPALQEVGALLRPIQDSIPSSAPNEFGARAGEPYRLKQTLQNPSYAAAFTGAEIERVFASHSIQVDKSMLGGDA